MLGQIHPTCALNLDGDTLTTEGRCKQKPARDIDTVAGNGMNVLNEGKHVHIWTGHYILLFTSFKLGDSLWSVIETSVECADGIIMPIIKNADKDMEKKTVDVI